MTGDSLVTSRLCYRYCVCCDTSAGLASQAKTLHISSLTELLWIQQNQEADKDAHADPGVEHYSSVTQFRHNIGNIVNILLLLQILIAKCLRDDSARYMYIHCYQRQVRHIWFIQP